MVIIGIPITINKNIPFSKLKSSIYFDGFYYNEYLAETYEIADSFCKSFWAKCYIKDKKETYRFVKYGNYVYNPNSNKKTFVPTKVFDKFCDISIYIGNYDKENPHLELTTLRLSLPITVEQFKKSLENSNIENKKEYICKVASASVTYTGYVWKSNMGIVPEFISDKCEIINSYEPFYLKFHKRTNQIPPIIENQKYVKNFLNKYEIADLKSIEGIFQFLKDFSENINLQDLSAFYCILNKFGIKKHKLKIKHDPKNYDKKEIILKFST